MTDTPLYCPTKDCHQQLGALRPDGTFVDKHRGRQHRGSRAVCCEECHEWTQVDKLKRVG